MKLFKSDKIFWIVTIFLILENYIPSELFFILGFIYCLYYTVFKNGRKIFLPFKEYKILVLFLILGSILGLIYCLVEQNGITIKDFIRDVFYFMNPLVFIYIGAIYAKKDVDIYKILNAFILAGGILSVLQLGNSFFSILNARDIYTVENWRDLTGDGIIVASISIAIILSNIIPKERKMNKAINSFSLVIMLIEFFITLSRTNLLIFVITYIIFAIKKVDYKANIKRKAIALITVLGILLLTIFLIPDNIKTSFIEKLISTKSEISLNHEWKDMTEIEGNWRGYETFCAVEQCKASPILKQLFGNGFGKRIYVGESAFLLLEQTDNGNPAYTIPVLHNGYATMLIKLGIFGVICYIGFYVLLIIKSVKERKNFKNINCKLLLIVGVIFIIQTYFLNGLFRDTCFYPLVLLMGYSGYMLDKRKINIGGNYAR